MVGDGALSFDGVNNLVKVPHSESLVFTDQITIAAWINLAHATANQDAIQKYGIALCELRDGNGIVMNILKVNDAWTSFAYTENSDYLLNQWHHLAFTYDGTQVINYLDGQEDGVFEQTGDIGIPTEGESNLSIGVNAPWNEFFFNGMIDDVRLYDCALSASEIENLYYGIENVIEQDHITTRTGAFELCQNYPNPFNPTTTITYSLVATGKVEIQVFNRLGQKVKTLVNAIQPAGRYNVTFNANQLPSGVYLYRIKAGNFSETKKMILIK